MEDIGVPQFDCICHGLGAWLYLPGSFKSNTNMNYSLSFAIYKSVTESIVERRFDAKHRVPLNLSRSIIDFLGVNFNVKRVMSSFNLTSVDFTQNICLASVLKYDLFSFIRNNS
jgi:hypothetical protein